MIQDKNAVAEAQYQFHFMFNQQDCSVDGQSFDQPHHVRGLFGAHACRRFVKQEKPWPGNERDGDLECPLLAVRKEPGNAVSSVMQSDIP